MFSLDEADLQHVCEYAKSSLKELANARIFLTGGTGFFGRWLLESLCYARQQFNLQTEITVLSRNPAAFAKRAPALAKAPGVHWVAGDVSNFFPPEDEFTHVIHAATEASAALNQENPIQMFDTVLFGTKRVLDFSVQKKVQKMLFVSSGAVYGKQPSELTHIPEDFAGAPDILDPNSAYAEAKRAAEHLCVLYHKQHHLSVKIARCFAFIGPYLPLDTHFAIGNFIRDRLAGKTIEIAGDGTPFRSYQYASDLVVWLFTILTKGLDVRPYNVGSSEDYNIAALASLIADAGSPTVQVNIHQSKKPGQNPLRYVPDVRRAESELLLKNSVFLKEAILKTMAWHSQIR